MGTRKERVILDLEPGPYVRGLATAGVATKAFVAGLDTGNDRATMLTQSLLAIGPTLVPLSAAAVGPLAAMTTQLGFAAAGAGVMVLGFNGVGDALEALREHQANPTEASLAKLNETMENLGPEAREFVTYLDEITPKLQSLREEAQTALPGFQSGIDDMLERLPQLRDIIGEIAEGSGQLVSEAGANLGSDDWDEFFDFLENEAQPNLLTFGRTVGNVFEGLANTWMELDPLSDGFASGLLDWSRNFADVTENLDENERFQGFLDYVQTNGLRAAEALGAIGGATASLVEAAAPVGAVALPIIENVADVFATIVDSPAGPVLIGAAAGVSAISRAIALYNVANGSAMMGFLTGASKSAPGAASGLGRLNATISGLKTGLPILGAVALAFTDIDDKAGLSNTAMLGTAGLIAGPWGGAILGGVGLTMDLAAANDDLEAAIRAVNQEASASNLQTLRDELDKTYDSFVNLGNEVGQGDWVQALGEFDVLELAKDGFKILSGSAEDARTVLANTRREAASYRDLASLMAGPLDMTGDAFERAAGSAEEFADSLATVEGFLSRSGSLIAYEAALDDLTASIKENGNQWGVSTEKGRANLEARNRLVETAIERSRVLKEAGDDLGAQRILTRAIDDLRGFGTRSKAARDAMQIVLRELKHLDSRKAKPKIDADNRPARRKIDDTDAELTKLDKKRVEPTLDADNRPAKKKTDDAFEWLYDLGRVRTVPKIDGDASGVYSAVAGARAALRNIPDEKVYIRVERIVGKVAAGVGGMFSGSDGGYTGDIDPREIAGVVHGREVVIPEPLVRRDAAHLRSRYGHLPGMDDLPGYADGGHVQQRTYVGQRAYYGPAAGGGTTVLAAPSLDGVRIEGRIDADGLLRGVIRQESTAVVREELTAERRFEERQNDRD